MDHNKQHSSDRKSGSQPHGNPRRQNQADQAIGQGSQSEQGLPPEDDRDLETQDDRENNPPRPTGNKQQR